ncbi:hypothetical protein CTEN210_10091 [Chaetoceros tenuissimus]|uniref:G-protein coupled receptors family 1 profile domain-containing protein n=1 Tax=Chaetoceros tenuissimus TaxID=426638 RepID=A0AAD3H7U7_9STRA|nr:hypothetical protein CTEN210_10091 [Chaetoceros tenuissimus]
MAVNIEGFSVGQWKANATTQIVSACISFLASLLIVTSTGRSFFTKSNSKNVTARQRLKKTSPYRRIIFLISFSDILYSLAFITGPFLTKKSDPQALWALSDSNAGCVLNGTFFSFGASTSLLYYAALCYFYYCKISKRITDEQFTRRYEKKIHIMIAIICVAGACLSIASKTYNTFPTGTFCTNANRPAGCFQRPEIYGECDAEIKVYVSYFTYFSLMVPTYSIVVMLYSMIRLIHSVVKKDKQYGDLPGNPSPEQLHKYNVRKQLLKETMIQAIMYTVGWFICQSGGVAGAILHLHGVANEKFPPAVQIYGAALIPLNSAFNVFIYTRPAVRHVRRVDPSISWYRAFYMVLKAGGEAPNMEQSSSSTQQQQQQRPQPEESSREAFGTGGIYEYHGCDFGKGLDSLNADNLGSFEDLSEGNVAFRSENKWSYNVGDISGLDRISEEKENGGNLYSRFNASTVSGQGLSKHSGTSKVSKVHDGESGLSFSAMPSSMDSRGCIESGLSLSDVDLFEDDSKLDNETKSKLSRK